MRGREKRRKIIKDGRLKCRKENGGRQGRKGEKWRQKKVGY